jgi:HEAT repeat protein
MLSSVVAADSDRTPTQLQKKLDSLFVIASSGELKYRDKVEPAIESIAKLGVLVVPPLIDKFTTNSARERLTIINIFKKIGSPAVPDLVDALSRPNWLVVKRVCWALGDIGDTTAVMPLLNSAGHENWQVREYCLGALGKIGDLRAVDAVINSFSDSVGQVRKAAVFSAGKLKSAETISQLIQALDDPYYGARLSAVEALQLMDTARLLPALKEELASATGLKAKLGMKVLSRIGNDEAMYILSMQLESKDRRKVVDAAIAIVSADPQNICGYHESIYEKVTDRLALIKIESARAASGNGTHSSN